MSLTCPSLLRPPSITRTSIAWIPRLSRRATSSNLCFLLFAMSTNEKIRCTYQPCGQYFESIDAMRSHKSSADNHHYCGKCDMDFMNHALLHLHKIMSQRHFACLECELELRSPGGLRHHVKMVCPFYFLNVEIWRALKTSATILIITR